MKSLSDQLAQYAAYHRDRRNIVTHFLGIPLIVFSVMLLLWYPIFGQWNALVFNPALGVIVLSCLYYLRLDLRLGLAMLVSYLLLFGLATWLVRDQAPSVAWILGAVCFVIGWIIQAIGHVFEGRKPAFVDDLIGLVIGPLFVVTELGFLCGFRKELSQELSRRAGPTH